MCHSVIPSHSHIQSSTQQIFYYWSHRLGGLGHRPVTPATWVRIPLGPPVYNIESLKMKHTQTHNFALTQEELKIIIQAIECFIDPKKPRWAKDEATDNNIILLLNKVKDKFYP
jgi:hypothetical protein